MITDSKKWHYLAVKKLSALFCKIISKHVGDFCCLNCLRSFRTENKLKNHENVCKNHDYCYMEMSKEESILKNNHGEKSMKIPFIIHADMDSLFEKVDTCHNNPENPSTTKINKLTAAGYSLFSHSLFNNTKNKYNYYSGKDFCQAFCKDFCKNLCKDLRKHAI